MSIQKTTEKLSFTEFSPVSADQWMTQINTDLKGKKWEDYYWEIEPGLVIDPAQFDPNKDYQPLFPHQSTFWITQELTVSENLEEANSHLLRLLMEGVSAAKLVFTQTLTSNDWRQLLDQVKIEYLRFLLCFPDVEMAQSSLKAIPNDYLAIAGEVMMTEKNEAAASAQLEAMCKGNLKNLFFQVISSDQTGFVDQLTDLLLRTNKILSGQTEKQNFSGCAIDINMGNKVMAEIAKFRAMRLLIALLFKAYGLKTSNVGYRATVQDLALSGEPELDLIRLTTMTLGAKIGGVDAMSYPVLSTDKMAFHQRISSNIAHVYELESHVGKVGDPLAGSYFIEALTDQMAQLAWQKFQAQA